MKQLKINKCLEERMPNPVLDALKAAVERETAVVASAVTLINGIAARVQAAVDAALANGATAAELAPVQDEVNAMVANADALAAAVQANT
jgi:hypothetical protein